MQLTRRLAGSGDDRVWGGIKSLQRRESSQAKSQRLPGFTPMGEEHGAGESEQMGLHFIHCVSTYVLAKYGQGMINYKGR